MKETTEEWKLIENCKDYAVSNYGEVKSAKRLNEEDKKDFSKWKTLKPRYRTPFYKSVTIIDNDGLSHQWTIHRLVATHFIDNPYNLPCVNHKDENKLNNKASNLEWCTQKYNCNYGHMSKKVYSFKDKILFLSMNECAKYYKVSVGHMRNILLGKANIPTIIKDAQLFQCETYEI